MPQQKAITTVQRRGRTVPVVRLASFALLGALIVALTLAGG